VVLMLSNSDQSAHYSQQQIKTPACSRLQAEGTQAASGISS
jgi:hypothetical protein